MGGLDALDFKAVEFLLTSPSMVIQVLLFLILVRLNRGLDRGF